MAGLFDKRLIVVTGKGGVGKTTVAAALGMAAARAGRRTIVCEVSAQERVSGMFGRGAVGYSETEVAERLYAISVDPEHAQEEYLRDQIPSRTLYRLLVDNRIFSYLAAATPGLRELVTIGKIWELAQLERRDRRSAPYDLVIVDAPATGHGLGMLGTPRTFRDVARVGPLARRADYIHSFLTDPALTGVAVVALPEEMPVNETLELRDELRSRLGMEIDVAIVNGVYPERFTGPEAERIAAVAGEDGPLGSALHAALAEHNRARTQRVQLRRLRKELDPVVALPYLFEPELRGGELERLSRELERRL
ncbi:MAG TPA: ArsA family ATPase [Thermoleophilaceae bacterium]|nr:ArsA family ATPase [Thermoleophilaceae bacterium]